VRDLAAIALASMGPKAAPAIPELIQALADPVNYVRASVANTFGAMGPAAKTAVNPLAERLSLKDEDRFVLTNICYALGDMGPAAKDALPALKQALGLRRQNAPAQEAILRIEEKPVPTYREYK
jgi:HEAT repeat protein